jgi:hypothetical protein
LLEDVTFFFFHEGAAAVWLGFTMVCGVVALAVPRDWMAWLLPSAVSGVVIVTAVVYPITIGGLPGMVAGFLFVTFLATWLPWIAAIVGRGVRWAGDAYVRGH